MANLVNAPSAADWPKALPGALNWLNQVYRVVFDQFNSGTTADRPTTFMYEGKPYADITIGVKIFWINGAWRNGIGAPV